MGSVRSPAIDAHVSPSPIFDPNPVPEAANWTPPTENEPARVNVGRDESIVCRAQSGLVEWRFWFTPSGWDGAVTDGFE